MQPPAIRPNGRGVSWPRWLLAAFAGLLGVFAAVVAMEQLLGPSPTGNTVLYARTVVALLIGTVAAGLTSGARTAARWMAAFLLVLVAAVGLWFLYLAYSMLTIGI